MDDESGSSRPDAGTPSTTQSGQHMGSPLGKVATVSPAPWMDGDTRETTCRQRGVLSTKHRAPGSAPSRMRE